MDNIGIILRNTRESSGVSIKEASEDLSIEEAFLLNIEEGKIGCFQDIFALKDYLANYAKYLGLDSDKLLDEFNEYMFNYTSKIPVKEIEKKARDKARNESNRIASPYTRKPHKYSRNYYLTVYLVIFLLIVLAIIWSIKVITIDNEVTKEISYIKYIR